MANALNSLESIGGIMDSLPKDEIQHMRRVADLVEGFAKRIQKNFCEAKNIEGVQYFGKASYYHDIGKAWIPRNILTKPCTLEFEEMSLIRRHPLFAEQIFTDVKNGLITGISENLLKLAADSAVYHHEWWNGNGYPYGIRHNEIPLVARITAICDAFDAMTSDRSYRKAFPDDYAYQEIKSNAGTQFDPELALVFASQKLGEILCESK